MSEGDPTFERHEPAAIASDARPPWTVIAYAALVVVTLVIAVAEAPDDWLVYFTMVFWTLLVVGLWRRRRAAWGVIVLLEASALVAAPFVDVRWWEVAMGVAALALLLARPTRQHMG